MRSVLLYLALVGAPVLGILGILRAGERLVPPRHVGGTWEVVGIFAEVGRAACPGLVFPREGAAMEVSQSGTRAVLALNDSARTSLNALLEGHVLTAATPRGSAACGGRGLRLQVVLDSAPGGEVLSGAASAPGCAGCLPLPFRAVRAAPASAR